LPTWKKISRQGYAGKSKPLVRWSVQEVRRIAVRLAQRRIEPALIIAWSLWRRAHQAAAQRAHQKQRMQL
jgi:phosphohistidine phosphatase SixA